MSFLAILNISIFITVYFEHKLWKGLTRFVTTFMLHTIICILCFNDYVYFFNVWQVENKWKLKENKFVHFKDKIAYINININNKHKYFINEYSEQNRIEICFIKFNKYVNIQIVRLSRFA